MTANQPLSSQHWAPANAKLLACKTLCLPHLEYTGDAWNPRNKKYISDIEQLQDQAVRFIAGIENSNGVCGRCQD